MKRKKIIIILIISVVALSFTIGIAYSAFSSKAKVSMIDQKIAAFVFNAEKKANIEIPLENMQPGDKIDYAFSVTNNDEEAVSEVNINYQIIIKTFHFIPLELKLYKITDEGQTKTEIGVCNETFTRNAQNELVCNMPAQTMNYSEEYLDDYKLEVFFPEEYNGVIYSGLVDFLNLEIHSEQSI